MNTEVIKHANITGIADGAKVTGSIPATGTHTALYLRFTDDTGAALTAAEIATHVTSVKIRLGAEIICDADAAFLLSLQQYFGAKNDAMNIDGVLPIFYTRQDLPTPEERVRTALGMLDAESYTVEMDLLTPVASCTLTSIEVFAERMPFDSPLGEHLQIITVPQSFASIAGQDEVNDLPGKKDGLLAYLGIHIFCDTASCTMDSATVIANQKEIFSEVPLALNQARLERSGRTPQSNYYHIDFATGNHVKSRLRMSRINEFRQKIQFGGSAAPGNYTMYVVSVVDIGDNDAGFARRAA